MHVRIDERDWNRRPGRSSTGGGGGDDEEKWMRNENESGEDRNKCWLCERPDVERLMTRRGKIGRRQKEK